MRHLIALALTASLSLAACGVPPEEEKTAAGSDELIYIDFRPDLVPILTLSDPSYPYVYSPTSIGVTNNGFLDAGPSQAKLECFAYNSGGFYVGQCISTVTLNIAAVPAGQTVGVNLPFTPGPLACKTAKCVVRFTVDSASQINERNENNNVIEQVKIP